MKELADILEKLRRVQASKKDAVLATVVKTKGSAYRRPGTRMLIEEDGSLTGFISAGCLEADLIERAQNVRRTRKPTLVTYDTSSPEDIVWGLGLGCDGFVYVLLEDVSDRNTSRKIDYITEGFRKRQRCIIATVFRTDEGPEAVTGSFVVRREDGKVEGTITDSAWLESIERDCSAAFRTGQSRVKEYQLAKGKAELLIEVIHPPIPLVIFGAGPDVPSVVRCAKWLGWHVTVIDKRQDIMLKSHVPEADKVLTAHPEDLPGLVTLEDRTAALIMTHNYLVDAELLKFLLPSPAIYVGLLGPKRRTEQLLDVLKKEGFTPTSEQLSRLYAPIGLDIGSDSAEQIALSILAEIQAVLAGRPGGFLRDRKAPIHD